MRRVWMLLATGCWLVACGTATPREDEDRAAHRGDLLTLQEIGGARGDLPGGDGRPANEVRFPVDSRFPTEATPADHMPEDLDTADPTLDIVEIYDPPADTWSDTLAIDSADVSLADASNDQAGTPDSAATEVTSCPICDDLDPCNGLEGCDPDTGTCVTESFPACPKAPPECSQQGGDGGPASGKIVSTTAGGFRLYDEDEWATSASVLDQLEQHWSITPTTLDDVLDNLNRTAIKVSKVTGTECFHTGYTWNSGDQGVTYWYPQGITGSGDATNGGDWNGRKVNIVSWYHKPENDSAGSPNKGVRLSVADVTSMGDIHYRLVLLVKPVMKNGIPDFEAVPVHAGGIVWYANYLYVADTSKGFRVFDMNRILKVQTGGDKDLIGKVSEQTGYVAHNYLYVIPQVTRYRLCAKSCCARFSYVSLDRSTSPHSLLAGEYTAGAPSGRVHRWPLDEATGQMLLTGGRVQATEAHYPGVENMQGGFSWQGHYFLSCSGGDRGLYIGKPGQAVQKRSWPNGPEDLTYAPATDNLWSLTEHPGSRYVFAVKKTQIQTGCN